MALARLCGHSLHASTDQKFSRVGYGSMKHDPIANHRTVFLHPKARIHPKKPKKSVQGESFSSPGIPIEEEGGRLQAERIHPPAFRLLPFGGRGNPNFALQCVYDRSFPARRFIRMVDFSPQLKEGVAVFGGHVSSTESPVSFCQQPAAFVREGPPRLARSLGYALADSSPICPV